MPKRPLRRKNKHIFPIVFVVVSFVVGALLLFSLKRNFDIRNQAYTGEAAHAQEIASLNTQAATLNQEVVKTIASKQGSAEVLQRRRESLKALAKKDPMSFLSTALPKEVRDQLPASQRLSVESETEVEGTLEIFLTDDFENHTGDTLYVLTTSQGQRNELYPTDDSLSKIQSGSRVRVKGLALDNLLVVYPEKYPALNGSDNTTVTRIASAPSVKVEGTKKILVVPYGFSDTTTTLVPEDIQKAFFSEIYSTNSFYKENSSGKVTLTGDVTPFLKINMSITDGCRYWEWANQVDEVLASMNIDRNAYDHIAYINTISYDCSWGGMGELYGKKLWLNGGANSQNTSYIAAHELGHNFGLHHASSLSCTDANGKFVAISQNCYQVEYGDPFDVMGWNYYGLNNYNKLKLGWLAENQMVTVTKSGTHKLHNHLGDATTTKLLRVPRERSKAGTISSYFYLENRKSSGYFDVFPSYMNQGVLVRTAAPPEVDPYAKTGLFDATPSEDIYKSNLAKGKTLKDATWGVKITNKDQTNKYSNIKFELSTPICGLSNPSIFSSLNMYTQPGSIHHSGAYVFNNDTLYCDPSTFTFIFTVPDGWQSSPPAVNTKVQIEPRVGASVNLWFIAPSNVQTDRWYPASIEVINEANPLFRSRYDMGIYVYSSSATPSPSVSPSPKISPSPNPSGSPSPKPSATPSPFPTPSSGL